MVRVLTILLSLFLSQYVVNDTFLYQLGPFCLFLSALQPSISLLFPLFQLCSSSDSCGLRFKGVLCFSPYLS